MKDYKKIWDGLSTSFADAAHFVGYQGDEQEIRANGAATASFLREVLQIGPQDKVLEIGCGIARIGRELAPYCGEWHGADISGNMIRHARARTKDIANVYLHELPDSSLDIFSDRFFDAVYSSIVFMHLDKVEVFGYIRDAYRVLATGGRAYFDTSNLLAPQAWQEFLGIVETYPSGKRPGHVAQYCTPQELEKYVREAGFESVHVNGDNPQLVVALGSKSGRADAPRPASALRLFESAEKVPMPPATDGQQPPAGKDDSSDTDDEASARHWKRLDDNLRAKNLYITELEQALAAKNKHIARLEQIVVAQRSAMSALPVRIALRLTRRRGDQ